MWVIVGGGNKVTADRLSNAGILKLMKLLSLSVM